MKELSADQFKEIFLKSPDELEIIDVRQPEEFAQIKIKGSKLIPMQDIGSSLQNIDWSKKVVFVCRTGSRSGYITQALSQYGYDASNLKGGLFVLSLNCEECVEKGYLDKKYFE